MKSRSSSSLSAPTSGSVIGDLQRQQNRFQEALLAYDHALSLDPRHLDAADKGGSLLIELQLHAEALARFEQSDRIQPGRPTTLISKALCFQALMRPEEAAASYAMALGIDAKNYVARNNMGVVLLDLGRFEEAAAHFRKVIEARPDIVNGYSNLGLALTQLKRFDEALAIFDRAVKLDPNFARPSTTAAMRCGSSTGWSRRWRISIARSRSSPTMPTPTPIVLLVSTTCFGAMRPWRATTPRSA